MPQPRASFLRRDIPHHCGGGIQNPSIGAGGGEGAKNPRLEKRHKAPRQPGMPQKGAVLPRSLRLKILCDPDPIQHLYYMYGSLQRDF